MREKVVAYVTWGERLLVFRHTEYPEAGIQVPGGLVNKQEKPEAAAIREAHEESGLEGLTVHAFLGLREYDFTEMGHGLEKRYYYHLVYKCEASERWIHDELTPSDDTPGPIEFELYWVRFPDDVPKLYGHLGDLISEVSLD